MVFFAMLWYRDRFDERNLVAEVGAGQEVSWFLRGTSETVVRNDRESKRLNRLAMSQP
jgi:hypothetical protein